MNRRHIFTFSATTALGLAFSLTGAIAQTKPLKDQIVGTWTLVSHETTAPDGTKSFTLGANPNGVIIFDGSGAYALVFTDPGRPKWKSPNRNEATQEDIKSAFLGTVAQSGTWSVDEDGKTVVHRVRTALNPNVEGREYRVTVAISGDELRVTEKMPNGSTAQIVERRATK